MEQQHQAGAAPDVNPTPRGAGIPAWVATGGALSWRLLAMGVVVWILLQGLIQVRLAVLPVLAALFLTAVLIPSAHWLHRRGWPRLLATWTVLLTAMIALAGIGALIVPTVGGQIGDLADQTVQGFNQVVEWLRAGPLAISQDQFDRALNETRQTLGERGQEIAVGVLGGAALIGEIVAGLLLALVLTFFFVKDGERMTAWLLGWIPESHRTRAADVAGSAWNTIGGYLRGTAVLGLADAVMIGVALLILDVPLVVPLVVITFFGAFLPFVGATVSGALAALVALVDQGPVVALIVIGVALAVQQIEGNVLGPIVFRRAVNLHPVVTLLSLTVGAVLGGIIGAFLAVPIAASVGAVAAELRGEPMSAIGQAVPVPDEQPPTAVAD